MISKFKAYLRQKIKGETDSERLAQLKKNGLKVGNMFTMQTECIIDPAHCWLITIGDDVTLAPRVHILAHDASTKQYLNHTRIGLVNIGNRVFIGAGAVILPNVSIGDDVIIGAGSVVTKDIPANSVAAGSPAKVIIKTDEYIEKNKQLMETRPVFDRKWTTRYGISNAQKQEMISKLADGIGFVE